MTFDQYRRKLRMELHAQRIADKENTEARFQADAEKLDAALITAGFELNYRTEWVKNPLRAQFNAHVAHLNSSAIDEEAENGIKSYVAYR